MLHFAVSHRCFLHMLVGRRPDWNVDPWTLHCWLTVSPDFLIFEETFSENRELNFQPN